MNLDCKKDFKFCCESFKLYDLTKIKTLGSGAYGTVYLATAYLGSKKVDNIVVKEIRGDMDDIVDMRKEVEYSIYMSKVGVGPKIYCTFYQTYGPNIKQYIIMQKMDMDCLEAIKGKLPTLDKIDIVNKMCLLIHESVYKYKIYCTDIKMENFMYTKNNQEVKMIDFGGTFCTRVKPDNIDNFYYMMLIQLYCSIDKKYTVDVAENIRDYCLEHIGPLYILYSSYKTCNSYYIMKGHSQSVYGFYKSLDCLDLYNTQSLQYINEYIYSGYNNRLPKFKNSNDIEGIKTMVTYIYNMKPRDDQNKNYKQITLIARVLHSHNLDHVLKQYTKGELYDYSMKPYVCIKDDDNHLIAYDHDVPTLLEIYMLLKQCINFTASTAVENDIQNLIDDIYYNIIVLIKYKPYDIVITFLSMYTDVESIKHLYTESEELTQFIRALLD